MTSSRCPPARTPMSPWFHPVMTPAVPSGDTVNGLPPSFVVESNSLPVLQETPTYFTDNDEPFFACLPLPFLTSLTTSLVGALPVTGGTKASPLIGGFGLIDAHFVGAAGGGAVVGCAVGVFASVFFPLPTA